MDKIRVVKKDFKYLLIGLILGILTGWSELSLFKESALFLSDLFVKLLKFLSLPVIFFSLLSSVQRLGALNDFQKLFLKISKYTFSTTILAAVLGLGMYFVVHPVYLGHIATAPLDKSLNLAQQILTIIPDNLIRAFYDGNIVGIVLITLCLGLAGHHVEEKHRNFLENLYDSLFQVLINLISGVLKLMPLAIWAFVTIFTFELKAGKFDPVLLGRYTLCVLLSFMIHGGVILPLFVKMRGLSPLHTFKAMLPALMVAFFSRSSSAALPSTLACAKDQLKITERVSTIAFPLCSTINMNGSAIFIIITGLFASHSAGYSYSIGEYFMWVIVATIAAVGNAGVHMGSYFMASAVLVAMNVPLSLMGLILPLYAILDMFETFLNVWSDACVVQMVDKEWGDAAKPLSSKYPL